MERDKVTPCCGEETAGYQEPYDAGDHGGHSVVGYLTIYLCPKCGAEWEEGDLMAWDAEEVA